MKKELSEKVIGLTLRIQAGMQRSSAHLYRYLQNLFKRDAEEGAQPLLKNHFPLSRERGQGVWDKWPQPI